MTANLSFTELKNVLDHLSEAILLFDAHLVLVYINSSGEILLTDSAKHLVGYTAKKLFKSNNSSLFRYLKQSVELHDPLIDIELPISRLKNPLTVNFSSTPIIEQGRLTHLLVELRQVDRQIKISKEEQLLTQQNNTRLIVRGLAHEIKNPLGGLRGAAQLLDQELKDPELKEYTQIIIAESDRLQGLMDKMLGPNKPANKTWFNIHEALERVRHLVDAETDQYVVLSSDYDPSIPEMFADKNQIIQAILNITRNAVQAFENTLNAPQAIGHIKIITRVQRYITIGRKLNKLTVKIDIIDDGPGIKEELMPTIFYPMITGRAGGTGLGLSIAQSLINQHNGLIECESEPGRTIFSIFLPLENKHANS